MPRSLRILFISMEYPPETGWGGIASYVATIAPALAEHGHEVHVLSSVIGQQRSERIDRGVYIHRRDQISPPFVNKNRRSKETVGRIKTGISTYLHTLKLGVDFDVVEYPDLWAEGWGLALFRSLPLVAHIHIPWPVFCHYNGINMDFDSRLASFIAHFSVRRAHIVTCPSKVLAEELNCIGWATGKNIEIIPPPVDWRLWQKLDSVLYSSPTVLQLGRIEALKAPEILVQAMELVRKDIPQASVIFGGRSNGYKNGLPYLNWLKSIILDAEGFRFIGQVATSDVPPLILESRVVAITSKFESYSMVALEAMSAGRPVVVTSSTGVAELIKQAGGGVVVPPDNPYELCEALRPFLFDPAYAARVGEKARLAVRDFLDPHLIASKREMIYEQAMQQFKRN
jgi:glycogen synthase